MTPAGIEDGRLLRSISKGGKVGKSLSDWAVWSVVEQSAKEIGIEQFGAHDLRRTCAKLCREERRRPGTNQVPPRALLDPDDGTLSWVGAGDCNRGERQYRIVENAYFPLRRSARCRHLTPFPAQLR